MTANRRCSFLRVNIDVGLHVCNARLRKSRVLLVFLFGLRLALLALLGSLVMIEDVLVVEDVAAGSDEGEREDGYERRGRAIETSAHRTQTRCEAGLGSSRP